MAPSRCFSHPPLQGRPRFDPTPKLRIFGGTSPKQEIIRHATYVMVSMHATFGKSSAYSCPRVQIPGLVGNLFFFFITLPTRPFYSNEEVTVNQGWGGQHCVPPAPHTKKILLDVFVSSCINLDICMVSEENDVGVGDSE